MKCLGCNCRHGHCGAPVSCSQEAGGCHAVPGSLPMLTVTPAKLVLALVQQLAHAKPSLHSPVCGSAARQGYLRAAGTAVMPHAAPVQAGGGDHRAAAQRAAQRHLARAQGPGTGGQVTPPLPSADLGKQAGQLHSFAQQEPARQLTLVLGAASAPSQPCMHACCRQVAYRSLGELLLSDGMHGCAGRICCSGTSPIAHRRAWTWASATWQPWWKLCAALLAHPPSGGCALLPGFLALHGALAA